MDAVAPTTRSRGSGYKIAFWCLTAFLVLGVGCCIAIALIVPFVQKIREAQVLADDSRLILGKWQQQGGLLTLEFFPDGSVRLSGDQQGHGTYQMFTRQKISLETTNSLWGSRRNTILYEVNTHELVLTPESGGGAALHFTRRR
jgi:hypothetical protein